MTADAPWRLLERYGGDLQPIGALRSLGGAGGHSGSRLWRYASASGERLIRVWPDSVRGRGRIETIHGWLRMADGLSFIPQPFPARDGRTVQELDGGFWELTPWLPGAADDHRPPTVERVRAAFRVLGEFHGRLARDAALGPSPGLTLRLEELKRLTQGGFDTIEADLKADPDAPCAQSARAWLDLARRTAPGVVEIVQDAVRLVTPLQPCLRDARPEHFLFEGDRASGLVDFGAMDVETVAADLARLNGEWLPLPEGRSLRDEGMNSYKSTVHIDLNHTPIARAFEAAADVLIGERWVRWRFREGRGFDDPKAEGDGIARGLDRVRRLAARMG